MQRQLPAPRADVVFGNGETFTVSGRVARLIMWLCRNAQRVQQQGKGELSFSFRDGQVSARLAEMWDTLDA